MEFGLQCCKYPLIKSKQNNYLTTPQVCGDVADVVSAGAQFYPESECNMACTGDENYFCGAGNRISYYTWTGSPLDLWDFPTGDAAGEYKFLIGGMYLL
jgi:hypothetical protein